jgi:pyridinium-3,5-bisthiocarboxylic acid mononucleotide nickel chelatase
MHLHLDAVGGVAGDMFIAAMLDAFPDLREPMLSAIRAAGLPPDVNCAVVEHRDHALTGLRFVVDDPHVQGWREATGKKELGTPHQPEEGWREATGRRERLAFGQHRAETPFAQIRDSLRASGLAAEVGERAIAIFSLLAEVEGAIHGRTPEEVSFHELGGWDSIADIVGAAALVAALPGASWSVSTLPLGRGRTKTAHGLLPVPSPAASRLLEGYELIDDGLAGERVTPTGAAILKHVGATQSAERVPRRLLRSGYGFGTKVFRGISNVLRVLAFEEARSEPDTDRVAVIAFEVDDQSPEDLAIALDHLRAHPAVLDVLQMPAFGKKGRMTAHIQVLAQPEGADQIIDACFNETATLGLRCQIVERRVLTRRHETVEVGGRRVRVKLAQRPEVATVKVESDDLLSVRGGRAARDEVRRDAQTEGLKKDG